MPLQRVVIALGLLVASVGGTMQATSRIAGCYEFADIHGGYFAWSTFDITNRVHSIHRSMIVELAATPHVELPDFYALRVPGQRDSTLIRSYAFGSGWTRVGPDSVELVWGDGLGGIRIRAISRVDSLIGRASHFSDVLDGRPPGWFVVRGVRVACPGAASRSGA